MQKYKILKMLKRNTISLLSIQEDEDVRYNLKLVEQAEKQKKEQDKKNKDNKNKDNKNKKDKKGQGQKK